MNGGGFGRPHFSRYMDTAKPSIEHSRLIKAFEKNVPGCFVKDYSDRGGYITIMRGTKTIWDRTTRAENATDVPAETLCSIPRGNIQAPTLFSGLKMVRPGWRIQMRQAAQKLTESQRRRIEKDLGVRVFGD